MMIKWIAQGGAIMTHSSEPLANAGAKRDLVHSIRLQTTKYKGPSASAYCCPEDESFSHSSLSYCKRDTIKLGSSQAQVWMHTQRADIGIQDKGVALDSQDPCTMNAGHGAAECAVQAFNGSTAMDGVP